MYVRGGLTCHFRASRSCTSLKPDCRSSSQSAQSPIPSFHVLTFFEVKAMTPLAVPPDLNGFINMDLRALFAWFLHKYPLKEPISFAFLELAGLGQGRGVEQPSQSRKRQACQQHLPRRPTDPRAALFSARLCEWVGDGSERQHGPGRTQENSPGSWRARHLARGNCWDHNVPFSLCTLGCFVVL